MTTDLRDDLQQALGDGYRVERELGGAGMSRVFVATETALGRQVVVKVLPPAMSGAISVTRFRREILRAARLQHAHIVPLLAAGERGGLLYYTMPFVRGETLRERLGRVGELPVAEAVKLLRDVASALAGAHRERLVHRDVKPDNILLTEHDALLTDLGVSKALSAAAENRRLTGTGMALGTPAYLSPEQAAGDRQDHRADLYAWGVVAYETLTGAPPFERPTAQALAAAHVTQTPEPVQQRRPAVPPALAALVMRCLEKRPADRPQSADEIVRALDAIATVAGADAEEPPADEVHRDRRTLGIATLLAALLLAAGGAFLWWRLRTPLTLADRTAVAVLPFRVVGGGPSLRVMGEGIPDLVAAKLTGRIHALDVRTVLSAWRRAGGDKRIFPRDAAILLGRRLGAGVVLEGNVVATGKEVALNGTLVPVAEGGGRDRHATVRGSPDSLPRLLDALVGRLLVLDAGESDERRMTLASVPLEALESYLAARAHDRAGQYADAVAAYGRAIDADSTFALAALRLWITATNWSGSPREAEAHRLAVRHADRLGPRDRLLLGTTTEPERPRTCAERLREQERGVDEAPDMPDLWYLLGETLAHCAPAMGLDDAPRRALNAFNRVLTLDSTYAAAYEHMPLLYDALGDSARSQRALEDLVRADSAGDLRWMISLFGNDSGDVRAALRRLERAPLWVLRMTVGPAIVLKQGLRADDAERLLTRLEQEAATTADRARAAEMARAFALTRGQPRRAAAAMRAAPGGVDPAFALLAATFWDGDTTLAHAARDSARRALGAGVAAGVAAPPDSTTDRRASLTFALGADAAARRDTVELSRAVAALRAVPAPPAAPWANACPRRQAMLLDAEGAALARRGDAGALLAAADSMLREGPGCDYVEGAGNLIVASLWERAGDLSRAYAATRRYHFSIVIPFAFSTYLRERARLAALTGAREDAILRYRYYLTLRHVAEPSFAAHLASVRGELATLEAASAGR